MKLTTFFLAGASALVLAACDPAGSVAEPDTGDAAETSETETGDVETASAGDAEQAEDTGPLAGIAAANYSLDPTHAFLTFTVIHGGVSEYTVHFTDFDADLTFDPEDLASSSINVTIDPMGLNVNYPSDFKAGHASLPYETWPETLSKDPRFLQAEAYPQITFTSTSVEQTGDTTGKVTGDLTFLGTTKPVTMDVTFNGTTNTPWTGERDLLGFNAVTTINRSEYGQTSLEGVISDAVTIEFSGEFLQDEE